MIHADNDDDDNDNGDNHDSNCISRTADLPVCRHRAGHPSLGLGPSQLAKFRPAQRAVHPRYRRPAGQMRMMRIVVMVMMVMMRMVVGVCDDDVVVIIMP